LMESEARIPRLLADLKRTAPPELPNIWSAHGNTWCFPCQFMYEEVDISGGSKVRSKEWLLG
jgi:hypothetical protein